MNTAYNVFLGILQDTKNSDVLYVYLRDYVKPPYDYSDLLRWQWAQSVSALDKLVHDLIRIGMLNIFQGTRTPTPKYSSFVIDMDCYSQMIQFPILASSIFEGKVIRKLSYLSFQEPTKISDGLALIWSETNKWKKISDKIGLNEDYTKTKLKNTSIRRNQIVHEGDYSSTLLHRQDIEHSDTLDVIDFVESVGTAIYQLVK